MLDTKEYQSVEEMFQNYARIRKETFKPRHEPEVTKPQRFAITQIQTDPTQWQPKEAPPENKYGYAVTSTKNPRLRAAVLARRRERWTLPLMVRLIAKKCDGLSISETVTWVAKHFGMNPNDVSARTNIEHAVVLRQVCFAVLYLAKNKNGQQRSMPAIGRAAGGRDHTTVLHGLKRMGVKL